MSNTIRVLSRVDARAVDAICDIRQVHLQEFTGEWSP